MNPAEKEIVAGPSEVQILVWILSGEGWKVGLGEDPHWGDPYTQLLLVAAIHRMAGAIKDVSVRTDLQEVAAKVAVATTKGLAEKR